MKPFVYEPPKTPLDILYIDEDVLVVNKPSGLLTVPGKELKHHDSLELRVKIEYPNSFLVHRLDMDTSGVIIFALSKSTQRSLNLQFEKRIVKKLYEARVFGNIKEDNGFIDLPLIVDWPNRPLQKIDAKEGKSALTHWQVLDREGDVTRVALMPETGRTHQLRVHMMSLGHTILGDRFYGNVAEINLANELQLHAKDLMIIHPKNGKKITFKAPLPF
ncbi:RluA family pseudouridine synthase [Amylibacter sp.]|jgi:tRNA pseudouridine32 synthase/23S rRNA pseudouridine746 synthase|uniref:Pseudouridine synthase n=1 Tax=uncultured alpha proteobacterium EB080_L43F08 TaxID=710797 RepID=E0Y192_9PROT|nr:pseudouridylate synthases, 23S RNA-specific [uncultured alpha proteobacterium EB080_L43F08]MBT4133997.1 RluA family pseudouridine synthase [Rhodobacterales bacterium]MDA9163923.1 RluA family pseudouridine synthase [Amylibacter sp.]MBT4322413.1 RluA family pseudouridine synthase [Rhodobacterales bacterium]MBT6009238.1 RluA family pseudouridine synthase [Rhodobacterales bacterium]|tara:strand:- start:1868 stop:2521 length:654 start_codon:yes stop_codon:yes gene_type:complete